MLRNESLKLLTQKKYCQPKLSLFHQVCLCFEWPNRESHMNLGPTRSESQMRQMTPHFKGKWLQRETKTNSLRRVISFRTVPIHSSLWIFTFFFLINMPFHSCHYAMRDLTVLFFRTYGPFATYSFSRTPFGNDA